VHLGRRCLDFLARLHILVDELDHADGGGRAGRQHGTPEGHGAQGGGVQVLVVVVVAAFHYIQQHLVPLAAGGLQFLEDGLGAEAGGLEPALLPLVQPEERHGAADPLE
jgi:hypothetical protein